VVVITRLCSAILVLLPLMIGAAIAQQGSAQHAKVELLARQVAVSPGKDLQLGVHFMLEKGWHIYWINPGDSGQPPSFTWHLPPGFTAGEIRWPLPERLQPSKELVDYGYGDEVLLPLTIHTLSAISNSAPVEFGGEAKWLVCREVCIPERAQLHLTLPVSSILSVGQQHAQLFDRTDKLIPQPLPLNWKVSFAAAKDELLLMVRADKPITQAEFFPLDPGQIDNPSPQRVQPMPHGAQITMKKSDQLLKPISVLRGVLVIQGNQAYRIEAPSRQPIQ
jgi:DsbC/DsbD-like thiol-disulfide interchange protein